MKLALAILVAALEVATVPAQTRDAGPWWPNPLWGEGDQAGGSNWITAEKVLEAVRLVKNGRIYELGQVYEKSMPSSGQRTYALLSPEARLTLFPEPTLSSPTTSSSAPRSARWERSSTGRVTSGCA